MERLEADTQGRDIYGRATSFFLMVTAFTALLHFLYVAFSRFAYPFDLEWCESLILSTAARIYDGYAIYQAPTQYWVSEVYAPLYFYACAFLWKIIGISIWSARLISISSTLLTALLIVLISRIYSKDLPLSICASGLFLASNSMAGWWYDLARVDMLAIMLLMLSLYLFLLNRKHFIILAGIAAALSCLTKQNFFFIALFIPVSAAFEKRWKDITLFIAPMLGLFFIVIAYLHITTQGWSSFYIFELPRLHGYQGLRSLYLDFKFFITRIYPIIVFTLILIIYMRKRIRLDSNIKSVLILLTVSLVTLILSRVHAGGYINVYIPFYAILPFYFVVFMAALAKQDTSLNILKTLFYVQIFFFINYHEFQIPKEEDWKIAKGFNTMIRRMESEGRVLIPYSSFYSRYNGGETTIHLSALVANTTQIKEGVQSRIDPQKNAGLLNMAMESGHYKFVIINDTPSLLISEDILKKNYEMIGNFTGPKNYVGASTIPSYAWIRKETGKE